MPMSPTKRVALLAFFSSSIRQEELACHESNTVLLSRDMQVFLLQGKLGQQYVSLAITKIQALNPQK